MNKYTHVALWLFSTKLLYFIIFIDIYMEEFEYISFNDTFGSV